MTYLNWEQTKVNPLDIELDPDNFRFYLGDEPTQTKIIDYMVEHCEVHEIAKKIVKRGFNPSEPVTLVKEKGIYRVLEGNRRITTCKLILDRSLVPSGIKNFPEASEEIKASLACIPATIATSREDAAPYLAERHVSKGLIPWSPEGRQRYIMNAFNKGSSKNDIADQLGLKKDIVAKLIRDSKLIEYSKKLLQEKNYRDFTIETNPYIYFIDKKGVKQLLGLIFNNQFDITTEKDDAEFKQYMFEIAKLFLLKDRRFTTRSTLEEVFQAIGHPGFTSLTKELKPVPVEPPPIEGSGFEEKKSKRLPLNPPKDPPITVINSNVPGENTAHPPISIKVDEGESPVTSPSPPARKGKKHTPPEFLKGLHCSISDDHLASMTKELDQIDYKSFPIASAMLLRTMLNRSLVYLLEKKGRLKQGDNEDFAPILKKAIDETEAGKLFTNSKAMLTVLRNVKSDGYKAYLDKIVHPAPGITATATVVNDIGTHVRGLLEYILNKQNYT
jgi:hypothetical protein